MNTGKGELEIKAVDKKSMENKLLFGIWHSIKNGR